LADVYQFAVHPLHNPTQLARAYQPLMDHLNRLLPKGRVVLEASQDYQAYERKFRAREPHVLLPNPWQTIEAIKVGYRVIATAGENSDFRGVFLVRRDSSLRHPKDVKGKTLSYPSRTALAAAMMPQLFLQQAGLNVVKDTKSVYVGSQESSIMNVHQGLVDVGVTWIPPWRLFQKEQPELARDLKVIWETPSLVNNSVMVRDDVPEDVVLALTQSLLGLSTSDSGQQVLSASFTKAFYPATNADYEPVSAFIKQFEAAVRPIEG
jgi:phosphonate transport system substrate-binding protein